MVNIDDIATLARTLCGDTANEARIRCAIGRAYYAAYHCCLNAANNWCGNLTAEEEKNKGKHEKLYLRLRDHSKSPTMDEDLRNIAEEAKKLRALRVTADYQLDAQITMRDLTRGLQYMQNVRGQFSALETKNTSPTP